jgi:uncharacterized protein
MDPIFRIGTDRCVFTLNANSSAPRALRPVEAGRIQAIVHRAGLTFGTDTFRLSNPDQAWDPRTDPLGPRLFEYTDYALLVQGVGSHKVDLRHRDPSLLNGLTRAPSGTSIHGIINFRGHVGRSLLTVLVDGQSEYSIEMEIFPSKLDYEKDYTRLVGEVQSFRTSLALEYLRPTEQRSVTAPTQHGTIEWLSILRNQISSLEAGIARVSQHPFYGISRNIRYVRTDRIKRVTNVTRRAVIRASDAQRTTALRSGVRVPAHLPEDAAEMTLDTKEHRWISGQLLHLRRELASVKALFGKQHQSSLRSEAIRGEILTLEKRVSALLMSPLCIATRGKPVQGSPSLQLLSAPGYREVYKIVTGLRRALRIASGALSVSVKELHVLYEYWCFIALVQLLAEETGQGFPSSLLKVEEDALSTRLRIGNGKQVVYAIPGGRTVKLHYKPRLAGDAYLVAQEPDFLITFEASGWPLVAFVLDARICAPLWLSGSTRRCLECTSSLPRCDFA